MFEPFE